MKYNKKPFDFWIFAAVLLLLSIGIITVFSASSPHAYYYFNDAYLIFKNQLKFAIIGLIIMLIVSNLDYRKIAKLSYGYLGVSILLLIMVRIPGFGRNENGSWRWIFVGSQSFQPSELAKLALIIFLSYSLSKRKEPLQYFFKGFIPYIGIVGVVAGLLIIEPHLSATIIIILVSSIILFCAGAKIIHFVAIGVPLILGLIGVIKLNPYMLSRINSYMDPFSDPLGKGFQVIQSLYAIGSGGIFGKGIGKSMQKFLYIPEPHNDFIFAILCEEMGLIGVTIVLLLFVIFIWRGIKVSMSAPDALGSLMALGITSLIAVQTIFNIAVVTKTIPNTGISLPFFSAGGTSLVIFLIGVGILLNISKYSNYERM